MGSHTDFDRADQQVLGGDWLAVLLETLDKERDGFVRVRKSLFFGGALCMAALQRRDERVEASVVLSFQNHGVPVLTH